MQSQSAIKSRLPHIIIKKQPPAQDGSRYPVKRVMGEQCVVEADIFRDGPAALAAVIKWRKASETNVTEAPMTYLDNDRWCGEFPLEANTRYVFAIEAWTRGFISWRDYFIR